MCGIGIGATFTTLWALREIHRLNVELKKRKMIQDIVAPMIKDITTDLIKQFLPSLGGWEKK